MQQISISYLIRLTIRRYLFTLQFTKPISKKKNKSLKNESIFPRSFKAQTLRHLRTKCLILNANCRRLRIEIEANTNGKRFIVDETCLRALGNRTCRTMSAR